jgi:hypothetical protein
VSSDKWSAQIGQRELRWTKTLPHLNGDSDLINEIQRELIFRESIAVTPTGPFLVGDEADPFAVVALIQSLHPDAQFTGAPDLTTLWVDDMPELGEVIF